MISLHVTPEELANIVFSLKSYSKFGIDTGKAEGLTSFNSVIDRSIGDDYDGKSNLKIHIPKHLKLLMDMNNIKD